MNANRQMAAYTEAARSGQYAKASGLSGKYDNVRRLWEDEVTRNNLRPFLQRLVHRLAQDMRRIRILDLGCGSADGYELLTGVRDRDADLKQMEVAVLPPAAMGLYKGVDLNEDLLQQAAALYGHSPKLLFEQGDFTQGLPVGGDEEPYDLYFMSYGSSSHLNEDETMVRLLAEIADRTPAYSLVHCDWLGRYSYEWQSLWATDVAENRNMDYVVSYIYDGAEREARRDTLQHLTLRLVSRQEAEAMAAEASARAGVLIRPLAFYDRSVLTGRHMDTGDYNAGPQPIRRAVNALHEVNLRTDLSALLFDYVPAKGFPLLNGYYEHLQQCWNFLVGFTAELLDRYDERSRTFSGPIPDPPAACPEPLRHMLERVQRVVEGTGWYGMGLPRENIIEPQLGFALRHLVGALQQGLGCGHGFVGIFEIDKTGTAGAEP